MTADIGIQIILVISTGAFPASCVLAGGTIDLMVPSDAIQFIEEG
jgi:hypothetical protein